MPSPLLVGVDGSTGAAHALTWAATQAAASGAPVVAVHVVTYSDELRNDLPPTGMTSWRRTLEANLRGPWTEPARAAGAAVRCVVIEHESAADGVLAVAAREDAGTVVLGTHRRHGAARRMLGSTTYEVTHRAHAPVVVIPPGWSPGPDRGGA